MGKPAARIGDMHVCPMVTPGSEISASEGMTFSFIKYKRVQEPATKTEINLIAFDLSSLGSKSLVVLWLLCSRKSTDPYQILYQ